jgi:predicted Zn-dependent protease
MTLFSEHDARRLLERVLAFSRADSCEARLTGQHGGNIRYARNTVTTSGSVENATLSVVSTFGTRTGTASINEFDDEGLERVVRRAEELARLAPENPEFMPFLGPQTYLETSPWAEATARITPESRARAAAAGISGAKSSGLAAAGFLQDNASTLALMNANGLFAYSKSTGVDFSVTARTPDGTGSGWVGRSYNDVTKLDVATASEIAHQKALASQNPVAMEPGQYTAILEPDASAPLIRNLLFNMDARRADEGRSFLSMPGGGTKLGERVLGEDVTISSDPTNPEVPTTAWASDGRPLEPVSWIDRGVVTSLFYSRFWAQQHGVEATARPSNIIMSGGTASLEDLIRGTERGVLVTRTWYIRTVDPQTLLYTGLTRDGTFWVEDGEIRHAIKNFRFNESPVAMLNNVDALSRSVQTGGNLIPPMRVRNFTFSSLSDAI